MLFAAVDLIYPCGLICILSTWIEIASTEITKLARLRKTEPEVAVQATQALFWEYGYAGLGTRQIEDETGLTRFILQTAYGGKKALFLQAVDAYLDSMETAFLPDADSGSLEALAIWFKSRADHLQLFLGEAVLLALPRKQIAFRDL